MVIAKTGTELQMMQKVMKNSEQISRHMQWLCKKNETTGGTNVRESVGEREEFRKWPAATDRKNMLFPKNIKSKIFILTES